MRCVPSDGSCAEYPKTCAGIMPFDNVGMAFVYLTWNLVIAWNAAVAFLSADAFPEDTDQKSEVRRDPPHSGGAWTIVRPKRRGVERSVDETVKLGPRTSTARARGNTGTKREGGNNCAGSLGHCRGWKIWSKQAWALLLRCYHDTHGSVPWATSWNRSNPNQNKCMKSRRRQSANITTNRAAHDAKSTSATPGCGKNPIQARGQVRFNQHQGSATSRFLVAAPASLAICLATVVCMLVLFVACAPQTHIADIHALKQATTLEMTDGERQPSATTNFAAMLLMLSVATSRFRFDSRSLYGVLGVAIEACLTVIVLCEMGIGDGVTAETIGALPRYIFTAVKSGAAGPDSLGSVVKTLVLAALVAVVLYGFALSQGVFPSSATWNMSWAASRSCSGPPPARLITTAGRLRWIRTARSRRSGSGQAAHGLLFGIAVVLISLASEKSSVAAAKLRPWRQWPDLNEWAFGKPSGRRSHTMATVDDGSVWMFGGIVGSEVSGAASNELMKIDFQTKLLTTVETSISPKARFEHAMAAVGADIFVHGGEALGGKSDELWKFSTAKATWQMLDSAGSKPSARSGHVMAAVDNFLWLHGGSNSTNGRSEELWKYSVATETWEQIVTSGDKPSARWGHAMVAVDNVLWMHGGETGLSEGDGGALTSVVSDELWKFSTTTATWQKLTFAGGTKPSTNEFSCDSREARLSHTMAAAGGDLIIFGGVCKYSGSWNFANSVGWTQDIWKYSTVNARWEKLLDAICNGNQCGLPAEAFTAELAIAAVGADIFVHGGVYNKDGLGELSDKLWTFSTATATLVEVLTTQPAGEVLASPAKSCESTEPLDPGCGLKDHAMVGVGDVLWMHGGSAVTSSISVWQGLSDELWKYSESNVSLSQSVIKQGRTFAWQAEATNATWELVTPVGVKPSARASHAMVAVDNVLWMHGGVVGDSPQESSNELWKFSTTTKTWENMTRSGPTGRHDHAMAAIGTDIFVHGGTYYRCCATIENQQKRYDGGGWSDELWKFSTTTETWVELTPTGDKPSARRGHAMVAIGNLLFLFGGARGSKITYEYTDTTYPSVLSPAELWQYSKDTSTWGLLWTGDEPRPRYDHAMAAVGADIVIHGGRVGLAVTRTGYSDDLWRYSVAHATWRRLKPPAMPVGTDTKPSARGGHVMAAAGDFLFLHGGIMGQAKDGGGTQARSRTLYRRRIDQTWGWSDLSVTSLTQVYDDDRVNFAASTDLPAQKRWTELRLCSQAWLPCRLDIIGGTLHRHAQSILCRGEDGCTGISAQDFALQCSKTHRADSAPLQVSGPGTALRIVNSSLSDCDASQDGGSLRVENAASLTILDSDIFRSSSLVNGGAISILGASADIRKSSFVDCACGSRTQPGSGGAVSAAGFIPSTGPSLVSSVVLHSCSFQNNTGIQPGGMGGALAVTAQSTCSVTDSNFTSNAAATGGALVTRNSAITVANSHFTDNAAGSGGALAVTEGSAANINTSRFTTNIARGQAGGGAMRLDAASTLTVSGNTFCGNAAPGGGGGSLLWDGDNATIVPVVRKQSDAAPAALGDHAEWLCELGECGGSSHKNTAVYGPCVATTHHQLEMSGLPTLEAPGYAGVDMRLTIVKKDRYGQTVASDDSSSFQIYSDPTGATTNDPSILFVGSIFSGFQAGVAVFTIAVKPTFTSVSTLEGRTVLEKKPFVSMSGMDAATGREMKVAVAQVHQASNLNTCPVGFALVMDQGKTPSTGACVKCVQGKYISNPLLGDCSQCPPSATCVDGAPPLFGASKITGSIDIEVPAGQTVREAVAIKLGVEVWQISLTGQPSETRRAATTIAFELVASREQMSRLGPELQALGVDFQQTQASSDTQAAPAGVWEEVAGRFLLRACPPGYQLINTTDEGVIDYDNQRCSPCQQNHYIIDQLHPCLKCPEGARCENGNFESKVAGSEWKDERAENGGLQRRIWSCPAGYGMLRRQNLPAGDECKRCETGFYRLEPVRWPGFDAEVSDSCVSCPPGVNCRVGNISESEVGWWLKIQQVKPARRRDARRDDATLKIVGYKCDPGVCKGNNKCDKNRSGVVCGGCPDNHVLQVATCVKCPEISGASIRMWRIIFCMAVALFLAVAVYILCLAPVFGSTPEEYIMKLFGWPLRMLKRSRAVMNSANTFAKKTDAFGRNAKKLKLVRQYAKVFIGYFQVVGSFMIFKVEWPVVLGATIAWIRDASSLIELDFMELPLDPSLGCLWASYSYTQKTYVKLATPICVSLLCAMPVALAWILATRFHGREIAFLGRWRSRNDNWKKRYQDTVNTFWNNIMFWLFLIYPGSSLTALQNLVCRPIHLDYWLVASLYTEQCPVNDEGVPVRALGYVSYVFILVYPFGVPFLLFILMYYFGVHKLARQKIAGSLVSSMIGQYLEETSTASMHRLASFVGLSPEMSTRLGLIDEEKCPDQAFRRRAKEKFLQIFPEHARCGHSCCGHTLPEVPIKLLIELGHPVDLDDFIVAARTLFHRLDVDRSGSLDYDEIVSEMERIGISGEQAKEIMKAPDAEVSSTLLPHGAAEAAVYEDDFVMALIHVLGNALPGCQASDMVSIGKLFLKFDKNGDRRMDLGEFEMLALELVKSSIRTFTGRESLNSLDLVQLYVLRQHKWNRRVAQELEDGQEANNAENALDAKKALFHAETTRKTTKTTSAHSEKPIYRETPQQREKFVQIGQRLDKINQRMHNTSIQVFPKEKLIALSDLVHFTLSLKATAQALLRGHEGVTRPAGAGAWLLKPLHDNTDVLLGLKWEVLGSQKPQSGTEISNEALASGLQHMVEFSKEELDEFGVVDLSFDSYIKVGGQYFKPAKVSSRQRAFNFNMLNEQELKTYTDLIEIERHETALRSILLEHVEQVAFKLESEGIIAAPPLEWDGSLGPHEENVVDRLGFLLNAYTVQCWWWEIVEMLRKLILTAILSAAYKGTAPQLGGSIFTLVCFMVLQLWHKPYLNQGLNMFSSLALLSQFFTAFGALMFLVQEFGENDGLPKNDSGTLIVSWLILLSNSAAILIYPVFRLLKALFENGEIDLDFLTKGIQRGAEWCLGPQLAASLVASFAFMATNKKKAGHAKKLLPVLQKLQAKDIVGALELVISEPTVLQGANELGDKQLLRNVLREVLVKPAMKCAVARANSQDLSELKALFKQLQDLVDAGDANEKLPDTKMVIQKAEEIFTSFQQSSNVLSQSKFKFPQDLIKHVDPVEVLLLLVSAIPAPLDEAFLKALELAKFSPMMPVIQKIQKKDLDGAVAVILSSPNVLRLVARFDAELPRTILEKVLLKPAVQSAVEQAKERMPTEKLKEPFIRLQELCESLQVEDVTAVSAVPETQSMSSFETMIMTTKATQVITGFAELIVSFEDFQESSRELGQVGFQFPDDLVKHVQPVEILLTLASKIPAPLDEAFLKALELAVFAPMMPVIQKIQKKDMKGAVAVILSSPNVLRLVARFDTELPRTILEKVLLKPAVQSAVEQAKERMPTEKLKEPFKRLQELCNDLVDNDTEAVMATVAEVLDMFEKCSRELGHVGFKYPRDLVKHVDPVEVLLTLTSKIPAPLDEAFLKALELAAFAPLMPVIQKIQKKDLDGAVAVILSSPNVFRLVAQFDTELPRTILEKVLLKPAVQSAVEQAKERMPTEKLKEPFKRLQELCESLQAQMNGTDTDIVMPTSQAGEVITAFADVITCFREASRALEGHRFKYPQDLVTHVQPVEVLLTLTSKIPAPMDVAFAKALELAAFAPMMPVLRRIEVRDLEGAVGLVMSSPNVLRLVATFDAELPRHVLKRVLLKPAVQDAVEQAKSAMPTEELKAPFEKLEILWKNLDTDTETVLTNAEEVIRSFEKSSRDLIQGGFKYPQDLVTHVQPVEVLLTLTSKIPAPMDVAFAKALELAAFAPMMPVLRRIEEKDLEGAVVLVMSEPTVLEGAEKLDAELPRHVLKRVLLKPAVQDAVEQAKSAMPTEELKAPFEKLEILWKNLDTDTETVLTNAEEVIRSFEKCSGALFMSKFKYPQDLVKHVDPVEVLLTLASKIPAPLDEAFLKALELAACAPLMPVIQKIQKKDLDGAVAVILSSPNVLRLVARFDTELPRTILEKVLLKPAVQSAVEQAKERMPTEKLKEPFKRLQDLSKSLDADTKTVISKAAEVIRTFQKSSRVFLKSDFSFPKDLVKKVDPIEVLSILASKIPAPMNDAFVEALRMANKFDVGDDVTHLLDSLDHDAHAPEQPARAPAQLSAPPHLPGSTGDEDAGQVREEEDA